MHTESSVVIDRPIEQVFQLTNDHVAEWSIIVTENEDLHTTPEGVGSTFRTVTEDRGQRMEFDGVVTQYDPPHLNAIEMQGKAFDIEAIYTFASEGSNQTRVTQSSVVRGKGFVKIMFLLFGWMMKKSSCDALDRELNSLKEFCESHAPAK